MFWRFLFALFFFSFLTTLNAFSQEESADSQIEEIQVKKKDQQNQTETSEGIKFSELMTYNDQYFHPFFSMVFNSTDNVYKTQDDHVSDSFLFSVPGFWVAYPPSKEPAVQLNTSSTSAGGLSGSRESSESSHQLQSYLYYAVDFQQHAKEKENDRQNQTLEGSVQLQLKGGLGFEIVGQFKENSKFGGLTSEESEVATNDYQSKLYELSIDYQLSESFIIRTGFRSFEVDMIDVENDSLDRIDKAYTLNLGWGVSEITKLTIDYNQIRVEFRTNENHSTQYQITGNIDWQASEKTAVNFGIGQSKRNFDDSETSDSETTTYSLSLGYQLTDKASLGVSADRNSTESDTAEYQYLNTQSWSISYKQQFNQKFAGNLKYTDTKNENIDTSGQVAKTDIVIKKESAFTYGFREWLKMEAGFSNSISNSSIEGYSIEVNQFFIGISAAF